MARGASAFTPNGDYALNAWVQNPGIYSAADILSSNDDATTYMKSTLNGGLPLTLYVDSTPSDFGKMWSIDGNPFSFSVRRMNWVDDNTGVTISLGTDWIYANLTPNSSSWIGYNLTKNQILTDASFMTRTKAEWDTALLNIDPTTTTTMSLDGWYFDVSYCTGFKYQYIKEGSKAPDVQTPGTFTAVTTGTATVTLPTHQADDILVLCASYWGPNTATTITSPTPPTGWNVITQGVSSDGDGWHGIYWKRATSAAETNPVLNRGTTPTWDTGTDTSYGGVAFVVRGCETNGTPYDGFSESTWYTVGGAVTDILGTSVSGPERTLTHIRQCHGANNSLSNNDQTNLWNAYPLASNTAGTDLSMLLWHLRDEDSNVATIGSGSGGGVGGPAVGWDRRVTIAWKPPATALPPSLIIPSNQAVRRAANW